MSVAESTTLSALPGYALELAAFHRAFADELRVLVALPPHVSGERALDVGCGDGFYSELLSEHVGTEGHVIGIDVNPAFLELARRRVAESGRSTIEFREASLEEAPSVLVEPVDFVWCAQCLYDFREPTAAVRQMARLVRPGGIVAVLENDTLHQLLLPWSTRVELALRIAERAALEDASRRPSKYYVGRRLPGVLAAAGLEPLGFRTQAIDRTAPLDPVLELFLKTYFAKLLERVRDYLPTDVLDELRELVCPEGDRYLPRDPQFTLTWINVAAWGRRPKNG